MLAAEGRVILISGASRGIGRAIARALYHKGYTLSLGGRQPERLLELTRDWDAARIACHTFDAEDRATHQRWVEDTAARFGRVDGLINNAGILARVRIEDDDETALDRMWAVNVKAPLSMIRLTLPHLRRCGNGRVINIASLSGKRVPNDNVGYAMSKFALVALSHASRRLGWDDGIRCTAVCPGFVRTDMTAEVQSFPREQMTDPNDLAELVATVLALPNTASVAELLVNCRDEIVL